MEPSNRSPTRRVLGGQLDRPGHDRRMWRQHHRAATSHARPAAADHGDDHARNQPSHRPRCHDSAHGTAAPPERPGHGQPHADLGQQRHRDRDCRRDGSGHSGWQRHGDDHGQRRRGLRHRSRGRDAVGEFGHRVARYGYDRRRRHAAPGCRCVRSERSARGERGIHVGVQR